MTSSQPFPAGSYPERFMELGVTRPAFSFAAARAVAEDFESLVRAHRPRIFRFALASLRDRDAADTITQDCFVGAHRSLARFRFECSLETWLMQIAVNLIRDYARNRHLQFWKRTQTHQSEPSELLNTRDERERSPEAQALLKEQVSTVWKAAEVLPGQQRTVFLLRFVEEMSLQEIAQATQLKEGTVKTHLFRALAAVRSALEAAQ